MCGINGGYKSSESIIKLMVDSTAHRGPDATGLISHGSITFGHNRLSIIDTSNRSNQPMQSKDGRHTLVFNGEIYNFKILKNLLSDWVFTSEGDSEVLLASLSTWGIEALKKIEGMFAFAWYDQELDKLVLVRDQLGIKPLYFFHDNNTLLFSSELTGIIAGSGKKELDVNSVTKFLNGNYIPSPDTLIKGVQKLRPGHLATFKNGQLSIERYFFPETPSDTKTTGEQIRQVIGEEVKAQLVSDRPIGVFLSGGLDSSIVLHHAVEKGKIKTFSTSFEMIAGGEIDDDKFNIDSRLAKKTADFYNCEHTEFTVSLKDIRKELIPIIEFSDEPVANPTIVSQYLLSRSVREAGVVVALGGDGGDELWGGYDRHVAVLSAQYFQKLPATLQSLLEPLHKKIKRLRTPLGPKMHESLTTFPLHLLNRVLRQPLSHSPNSQVISERYSEDLVKNLSAIETFMRVDRELWLADDSLHRSDRTSMAVGLELRVPLLGLPVLRLADQIRAEDKFTPFTTKKILRQAYQGILPEHIFNQPKRGWLAPGAKWIRDPEIQKQFREVFSDSYYEGLKSLVDWGAVNVLLDEHISGQTYALNPLWNLFALQIWAKKHQLKLK